MQQPTPEKIKELFDPFYKADLNLWIAFAKHVQVRTFEKNETIKDFYKTEKYINAIKNIKPGLTMVIMHCTIHSEIFPHISDSHITREGDFLAMIDPELKKYIEKEGIILTTWREAMERRGKVK